MATNVPRPAASVLVVINQPLEVLMVRRPPGGMFGDLWVFPGGVVEMADGVLTDTKDDSAFRAAGVRELYEETAVELLPDDLRFVSRWVTPEGMPRRYDTRFYLGVLDDRPEVVIADGEVMEAALVTPATALAAHQAQHWQMVLPTLAHVRWLARYGSGSDAYQSAGAARAEPIAPSIQADGSVLEVELPL
ncbi:MAG TPA: NUDIX hydrolase [Acidimicrobiia bacterium]|nr:NUDIX hydrolase [Acidimicrobiia bacterium]